MDFEAKSLYSNMSFYSNRLVIIGFKKYIYFSLPMSDVMLRRQTMIAVMESHHLAFLPPVTFSSKLHLSEQKLSFRVCLCLFYTGHICRFYIQVLYVNVIFTLNQDLVSSSEVWSKTVYNPLILNTVPALLKLRV